MEEQEWIDRMIRELNPSLDTGVNTDANWNKLREEQQSSKPRYDMTKTVKSQTPVLLDFDSHQAFTYRRWDGAHWHTEMRNLQWGSTALQQEQAKFRDSFNTVMALTYKQKITWATPLTEKREYDPRYQLLCYNDKEYLCLINCVLYAQSTARHRQERGYTEISFNTRLEPVATQHTLELALDKLIV